MAKRRTRWLLTGSAVAAIAMAAALAATAYGGSKAGNNKVIIDGTTGTVVNIDPANESIFNQYTIRVEKRDALQAHLKNAGIGNSIYYPLPLHLQPCFAYLGYKEGSCPESERAAKKVLSLPIYPELTQAQLDEVVAAVRAFYGR